MILAWIAAAFVCGVWLGSVWSPAVPVDLIGAAAFAGAAVAARPRLNPVWFLVPAAVALGAARSPHPSAVQPDAPAFYAGRHIEMRGSIIAEPDIRDTGSNYLIGVSSLVLGNSQRSLHGTIRVHTSRAVQAEYGDRVDVTGRLKSGSPPEMAFPRMVDTGPGTAGASGWVMAARRFLQRGIQEWLPEPEAGLLIAITLGARSATLGPLAHVLVATGLIHIIAISGIKMAIVAGTLYGLVQRLGRREVSLLVGLLGLTAYTVITGATESGIRSAGMWALVFVAAYLGRHTVALVSLAAVSALMVGLNPGSLWDIAFQLSVLGTLAIVAFADKIEGVFRWLPFPWRDALAVTLAAQIGTLPIVLSTFHLVGLAGPLANALALPFLPALIVLGVALGAFAQVGPIAWPLTVGAHVLLRAVIMIAQFCASLPLPASSASLSGIAIAGFYGLALGAAWWALRRAYWAPARTWRGHKREWLLSCAVAVVALGALPRFDVSPHPRLVWLGSGDSFLLTTGSQAVLIGGSSHPLDLLRRLGDSLPLGRRTLDAVIVPDPRPSSVLGLQEVVSRYRVREVLDVGVEYPSASYAAWRDLLRARHVPTFALRSGARLTLAGARVSVLDPQDLYPKPADCTAMLSVELGGARFLLATDASERELTETMFRHGPARSTVLVTSAASPVPSGFLSFAGHPRLLTASDAKHPGTLPQGREAGLYPLSHADAPAW